MSDVGKGHRWRREAGVLACEGGLSTAEADATLFPTSYRLVKDKLQKCYRLTIAGGLSTGDCCGAEILGKKVIAGGNAAG